MTGLVAGKDKIIEVAAIITDKELNPLHEGYESVVHCSEEIMKGMDEWCIQHHGNVTTSLSPPTSFSILFLKCIAYVVFVVRINSTSYCII